MFNKKTLLTTLAVLGLVNVAQADTNAKVYIQGFAGPGIMQTTKGEYTTGISEKNEYKTGYQIGGAAGYKVDNWRAELEVSFRRAEADKTYINGALDADVDVTSSIASTLFNMYYDFGLMSNGISPYIGGGVGRARATSETSTGHPNRTGRSRSNVNIFQGIIGGAYQFDPNKLVSIHYRYVRTSEAAFALDGTGHLKHNFKYHAFNFMLTYYFS